MKPTPLTGFSEYAREFGRERYKSELAQGVFDLMHLHGINRSQLADLLGVTKGRVSQMLSGSANLRAESIADVFLVFGRAPHLTLGTNLDEVRFPLDEGSERAYTTATLPIRIIGEIAHGEETHGQKDTSIQETFTINGEIEANAKDTYAKPADYSIEPTHADAVVRRVQNHYTYRA